MPPHAYPQSGIVNRPPEHAFVLALSFVARDPAAAWPAHDALCDLVRKELTSDLDELRVDTPADIPSAETGELGFDDGYDRQFLTITLGLGRTAFDALGVGPDQVPGDLISIPWDLLGDTPLIADQGDLLLQICADSTYIAEHVVRRIEEELSDRLRIVYLVAGAQRYTSRGGRTSRREGRALIGFLDGTSNLRPRQSDADAELVFVDPRKVKDYPAVPASGQPGYGNAAIFPPNLRQPPAAEPDWTEHGTYAVVRASTNRIGEWDDRSLDEQQKTIGRWKLSGASLDRDNDRHQVEAEPVFATDPSDLRVPVDSHTRKANPRRPEDAVRRIFRRGYPLIHSNQTALERGLIFIAFARTISTQFEFIFRGWMRNPDFPAQGAGIDRLFVVDDAPIAGGYYFVPAIRRKDHPWSWILPARPASGG